MPQTISHHSRPSRPFGLSIVLTVAIALGFIAAPALEGGVMPPARSLAFFENLPADYDYGLQLELPPSFGAAEFTLELWIRPDESFPVGPTTDGSAGQLTNWTADDEEPYSGCCWWYAGNFLLDGHNNADFNSGTFSLQFYGGGRLRWLFGDGFSPEMGGVWSVGAYPATTTPSLLDGQWHRVNLVRRWSGVTDADLELWIDGVLIATETSSARPDLRFWWDAWANFPSGQEGWFWGVEKQAAIGVLSQYEDYKGILDAIRFFDRALTPAELAAGGCQLTDGLVGDFSIEEGAGTSTCDAVAAGRCITLIQMKSGFWSTDPAPGCATLFTDGFESGDFGGWDAFTP